MRTSRPQVLELCLWCGCVTAWGTTRNKPITRNRKTLKKTRVLRKTKYERTPVPKRPPTHFRAVCHNCSDDRNDSQVYQPCLTTWQTHTFSGYLHTLIRSSLISVQCLTVGGTKRSLVQICLSHLERNTNNCLTCLFMTRNNKSPASITFIKSSWEKVS